MHWGAVVDSSYKSTFKAGNIAIVPLDNFTFMTARIVIVVLSVEFVLNTQRFRFTVLTPDGILVRERKYNEFQDKQIFTNPNFETFKTS